MKRSVRVLLLILVLFLIFSFRSSFAITVEVDGTLHEIPTVPTDFKNNNYFIFLENGMYGLFEFSSDSVYRIYYKESNHQVYYTINDDGVEGSRGVLTALYLYNTKTSTWTRYSDSRNYMENIGTTRKIIYSVLDIYHEDGSIYFNKYSYQTVPSFGNSLDDFASGDFKYILVNPGNLKSYDDITFVVRKCVNVANGDNSYESQRVVYSKILNDSCVEYYHSILEGDGNLNFWYEIPQEDLGIAFANGDIYLFTLEVEGEAVASSKFIIGGMTEENLLLNGLGSLGSKIEEGNNKLLEEQKKTQEAIKESNETNKNIFQKIGDILSYINPLSENFFVYKLIELLGEFLQFMFVPSQEFLNNWITSTNDWLSDRLGVLYYPLDLVIDFLGRFDQISESSTAMINVPEFKLKFLGYEAVVIPEYHYNLMDLLSNDTFNTLHTVYLVVVDVILYLGLIVLAHNTFVSIFGGKYMDDLSEFVEDASDSYNNVKLKQEAKRKSNYIGFRVRK